MAKHRGMHKAVSRKAVASDLARLKGASRSDLADDRVRGSASPLTSKRMERKKGK
jgi:hypothetical protein